MRHFISIVLLVFAIQVQAQDFYDINTIQKIEITFAQSNWDQILDAQANGDEDYTMAQTVTLNGTVFDSVGVKYKGNSTYNANQAKNPFHIELNTFKDQDYQGYADIKLSNVAKDPSFLREVLSYQILRQYMHAPLSNYANVYVNGTLIGLYSNSESITKRFVDDRFGSKNNTFIKCNPTFGAGPQTTDFPSLEYLGVDSTAYYESYEMKSDEGWSELIDLCNTLVNNVDDIEEVLDVDRALWMLAWNNVLVNLDSYIGRFKQNYYLYQDDNDRFNAIVWDLNESFGRFSGIGSGALMGTTQKQEMTHLLNENDASFPLVQKLLSVPMFKRMYLAHFKTILKENFENGEYAETANVLQDLIDADVQADPNKFFTYQNFVDNINDDINTGGGPGGGSSPGITNLMDGRADYLLGLSDFTQTEPLISNINLSPAPVINQTFTVTAEISNSSRAYIGYRSNEEDRFTRNEMFDDGAHNDGAANDGIYGFDLAVQTYYTQYFIYAENDGIGKFSPQRAEHDFHTIIATSDVIASEDLVINEFMASNDFFMADQDGEFDDWIELYNNGSEPINLEGYSLSDDPVSSTKWTFPAGWTIEPNGYIIVWADNDEDQEGLHANFKLAGGGEIVLLSNPAGDLIDEISYLDQQDDISYGRFPNGVGEFQVMDPTFAAENSGTVNVWEIDFNETDFTIFPNPTEDQLNVSLNINSQDEHLIEIFNGLGAKISALRFRNNATISIEDWPSGLYFVAVDGQIKKLVKS